MRSVAYDVSRLFIGPISRTPRGIDRIDLILARHFFDRTQGRAFGVMPTPWGIRVYDGGRVLRGLDRLEHLWSETCTAETDPALDWLRRSLRGEAQGPAPFRGPLSVPEKAGRMLRLIAATRFSFGEPVAASLPHGSAYVNVGQITLGVEALFRWLDLRADVWAAFMLHDVIPLEHPTLVAPSSVRFHGKAVANTARFADGLIVSTQTAKASVREALAAQGRTEIPTLAARLPLDEEFEQPFRHDPDLAGRDYFVVCGAIELRKNLGLLLDVWRDLVPVMGPKTPHLAVVGTPSFGGKKIVAELTGNAATAPFIHVISGLSTPALKVVIAGARALLMPSLAEGFGLPIAEADALGCPVIASDLAAHREVIGAGGVLIAPTDTSAWKAAITAALRERGRPRPRHPIAMAAERREFIRRIEDFVQERPTA